ncbi:prepilin-type N-terminal cleavage/methylation domain-containing protein [Pseudomonas capeferrum]|uniref:type IV pilus modification PilV family protein n=1 Tax=Pseudomonas capeferrum TaxID=1495066 RepID=UPI0015E41A9B|nr:prepilin-type N-terminal cleavage/methylation domain-containing protein [Pseudomonas capeferrum]MBA1202590.1 prepilin-type N-terminal cleavage/methylation domain-containing protein [Pseudomonas capeferrum]
MDGKQQGMTLLEVLLAMTVLTFGLSSIAALQVRSLQVVEQGRRDTQAVYLAQALLERVRDVPLNHEQVTSWQAVARELLGASVQATARQAGGGIEVDIRWRDKREADGVRVVSLQGRVVP